MKNLFPSPGLGRGQIGKYIGVMLGIAVLGSLFFGPDRVLAATEELPPAPKQVAGGPGVSQEWLAKQIMYRLYALAYQRLGGLFSRRPDLTSLQDWEKWGKGCRLSKRDSRQAWFLYWTQAQAIGRVKNQTRSVAKQRYPSRAALEQIIAAMQHAFQQQVDARSQSLTPLSIGGWQYNLIGWKRPLDINGREIQVLIVEPCQVFALPGTRSLFGPAGQILLVPRQMEDFIDRVVAPATQGLPRVNKPSRPLRHILACADKITRKSFGSSSREEVIEAMQGLSLVYAGQRLFSQGKLGEEALEKATSKLRQLGYRDCSEGRVREVLAELSGELCALASPGGQMELVRLLHTLPETGAGAAFTPAKEILLGELGGAVSANITSAVGLAALKKFLTGLSREDLPEMRQSLQKAAERIRAKYFLPEPWPGAVGSLLFGACPAEFLFRGDFLFKKNMI